MGINSTAINREFATAIITYIAITIAIIVTVTVITIMIDTNTAIITFRI